MGPNSKSTLKLLCLPLQEDFSVGYKLDLCFSSCSEVTFVPMTKAFEILLIQRESTGLKEQVPEYLKNLQYYSLPHTTICLGLKNHLEGSFSAFALPHRWFIHNEATPTHSLVKYITMPRLSGPTQLYALV